MSSSHVRSAGYDPQKQTLEIEISSGGIYLYYDVPVQVFRELMRIESPGRYFQEKIKLTYNFRRIG